MSVAPSQFPPPVDSAKEITEPEIADESAGPQTSASKGRDIDAPDATPGATPRPGARPKKRKR